MQGLVDKKGRDTQAGFIPQEGLDGIGGIGSGPGVSILAGPSQAADPFLQQLAGGLIQVHFLIGQDVGRHMEDRHLGDLLFQGHRAEQISQAFFDGKGGIAIRGLWSLFPNRIGLTTFRLTRVLE